METELAVSRACLARGIIVVQCSVYGGALVAQVRTVKGGVAGACLACAYTATEWRQVATQARFSCDGSPEDTSSLGPTRSTSSLCSLAAELGVHRILRHVLGLGAGLRDELLEYRGYVDQIVTTPLSRNPDCPLDHQPHKDVDGRGAATIAEVLRRCGADGSATVAIDRGMYVEGAACGCGRFVDHARFLARGSKLDPCPDCGGMLEVSPFHSRPAVGVGELGAGTDRPLIEVGIDPGRAVIVRQGEDRRWLVRTRSKQAPGLQADELQGGGPR
jgi:hypothetical protein